MFARSTMPSLMVIGTLHIAVDAPAVAGTRANAVRARVMVVRRVARMPQERPGASELARSAEVQGLRAPREPHRERSRRDERDLRRAARPRAHRVDGQGL